MFLVVEEQFRDGCIVHDPFLFFSPCPSEWVQTGTYCNGHVPQLAGSGKVSPVCVRAAAC